MNAGRCNWKHIAEIVQCPQSGGAMWYGWVCPCGVDGGPYTSHLTAATMAHDHEQRHARAQALTWERFGSGVVFS